jgi:biopolymer transport protein ExbD
MAMQPGSSDDSGGEDEVLAAINTTPLVDIMLVLLIVFLITIPAVTHSVPVVLPTDANQPAAFKPETITLSVNKDGAIFWNGAPVADSAALFERMKVIAVREPQPEVHVRGDQETRYAFVGRVVANCQRAGIAKVTFITEPSPRE